MKGRSVDVVRKMSRSVSPSGFASGAVEGVASEEVSDEVLVREAAAGDRGAFERLARLKRRRVGMDDCPAADLSDPRAAPDRELLRRDLERALAEAMQALGPEERALVYLHEAEGVGLAELGATFGLREGTVKSRLFRARARLATLLREKGYG